ncbi:MAG: SOSS complex subunit B family protein [Candidatus Woesearchaeota archaeon]
MAIKDLEARQGNVDIVVDVVEVGEIKEFQKFGKSGRVATAKVKDETGEINLSLWNEQIDTVKAGQKLHITNGYVNEFQGELQLTTGKFGKLEVLEGEAAPSGETAVEGEETTKAVEPAPSHEVAEKKPEVVVEPAVEEKVE